ncbi:MAG: N-acetylglucosamine-6-phosphate deacetylase [Armatimonadota bacterium]|nr:N-acetylglucosamine-6-phosphate deacetylase [Armatimonadota bacterium]
MRILCGQVITPDEVLDNSIIAIEDGKVVSLSPADGASVDVDASDKTAVPGFIDLHIHGGVGHEVMDGTVEAIRGMSVHLAANGTTSWLPSALTGPWDKMRAAVQATAQAMREGSGGAEVLGSHLEGPFLNAARTGAQPPDYLRPPSCGEMKRELGDLTSVVRYMAVASELPGAIDLIKELCAMGVTVSLAHTDASYDEARAAFDAGATSLTHTYNAMRPLRHREPGVLAAALLDDRVTAELIWDNYHVHEAAARIAIKLKGPDRIALISDAVSAAGLTDGDYFLGGQPIRVEGGLARLASGTIAGSTITIIDAVRNAAKYFPLRDVIKMATLSPARSIGADDRKGRIAVGYDADVVLLNRDLSVDAVFLKGQRFQGAIK